MEFNTMDSQLNIQELQSTRLKILQIRESLGEFHQMINMNEYQMANWNDIYTKFNILVAKYLNLSEEIANFNYKKLFLHPTQPFEDELQVRALGTLLRTKQIPQVEELQVKSIQNCLNQFKEVDDSKLPDNDTRVLGDVLSRWQARIKRHNTRCDKVLSIFEEARETNLYKRRPEKRPLASKESQTSSPKTPTNMDDKPESAHPPPPPKKTNNSISAPKSLDQMMRWLSQGVKE